MNRKIFDRIALIGLGLIGSSLARVIAEKKLCDHVAGWTPSEATRARVRALGLVDETHDDMTKAVAKADLVMLCTPPGAFGDIARQIKGHLKPDAILSDVGSFKQRAISDIEPHLGEGVHFVPGHPIAGTEHSGPDAGFAELFEQRWVILTPGGELDEAAQEAVQKVARFWEQTGANISLMKPAHHDRLLALTSHLPHVIAWAIMAASENAQAISEKEVIDYSGGGFRDFTRLASSDPIMWRDVLIGNRAPVLEMIDLFVGDLTRLRTAIEKSDGDFLEELFSRTRNIRQKIISAGQETSAPDFGRKL